jgi:hypothetical protein
LGGGFQSYETSTEVRGTLSRAEKGGPWHEERHGTSPNDPRPPYVFSSISGAYELSGIDGYLTLTFYNNELMAVDFSTTRGMDYLATMKQSGQRIPTRPREEVTNDRRTRFRYDVDPGGTFRFHWVDPKIEEKWTKWISENS